MNYQFLKKTISTTERINTALEGLNIKGAKELVQQMQDRINDRIVELKLQRS